MKNVVIRLNSTNQVERFSYPAGERQVRLTDNWVEFLQSADIVTVPVIIKSPQDIIDLALLKSAIDGVTHAKCNLHIPYMPYARADRRFKEGDCEGLLTFARFLFAMSWDKVITLDAHSKVTNEVLPNIVNLPADVYIKQAIEDFALKFKLNKVTVILPDEGASERYYIPGYLGSNTYGIETDLVVCSKNRDPITGKLLGFSVPKLDKPAIIVDDLCDAGGTFLGIEHEIRNQGHSMPLGLYVTHGIFSKGISELYKKFTNIYTTDSFCDLTEIGMFSCWQDLYKG